MTASTSGPRVTCRSIEEHDLDAVADLLVRGFPERQKGYWTAGFRRMQARRVPAGYPRYGMMLDHGGVPVGVILLLFSRAEGAAEDAVTCNLSSWYVEPAYASHVATLVMNCLRRKQVTYTNISAAHHTIASMEAIKFVRYTTHHFMSVPWLGRMPPGARASVVRSEADFARFPLLPERDMLLDHMAMGCLCVIVEQDGEAHPFVFQRLRIKGGRIGMPVQQLIFARRLDDFVRFAAPIGRCLLWRGVPAVAFDTNGDGRVGLVGVRRRQGSPKYFRGPASPRLGNLAYTERVVFGP